MRSTRRLAKTALALSLLAISCLILLSVVTGRSVVSYASSGSMEPTIGVLDGFFIDPWPGQIQPGDILVFESVVRGGPAVHRVVGGDENGWLTQGDANAGIDQDAGEPLITKDRILGRVITRPDGTPIVIDDLAVPFIETRADLARLEHFAGGPRQLTAIGFLMVAIAFAVPGFFGRPRRALPARPSRRRRAMMHRLFPRGILGKHVGAALLVALAISSLWAAAHARVDVETSLVVLRDPTAADDIRATGAGQELARDVRVASLGMLPTIIVLEPQGEHLRTEQRSLAVRSRDAETVTVHERAGEDPGLQRDTLHVWRYPAILPETAIVALHDLVPGAPFAVLASFIAVIGALWYRALRIRTLPVGRLLGIQEDRS